MTTHGLADVSGGSGLRQDDAAAGEGHDPKLPQREGIRPWERTEIPVRRLLVVQHREPVMAEQQCPMLMDYRFGTTGRPRGEHDERWIGRQRQRSRRSAA